MQQFTQQPNPSACSHPLVPHPHQCSCPCSACFSSSSKSVVIPKALSLFLVLTVFGMYSASKKAAARRAYGGAAAPRNKQTHSSSQTAHGTVSLCPSADCMLTLGGSCVECWLQEVNPPAMWRAHSIYATTVDYKQNHHTAFETPRLTLGNAFAVICTTSDHFGTHDRALLCRYSYAGLSS